MKISYISTSQVPSTRANSIQVMKVCQALVQIGEEVHLFVPGRVSSPFKELQSLYGLNMQFPITWVPSSPALKRLDFSIQSIRMAMSAGTDVIYTRMLWVARLAQIMKVPVILELHDMPGGTFGPWLYRSIIRSKRKKLVVMITDALRMKLESVYGAILTSAVMIAPDGVDLERFAGLPDPVNARRALLLNEKTTAAYSGGFYEGRGLDTLFKLAQEFPQIQFLWIGGNEQQVNSWRQRLTSSGVGNVVLPGFIPNEKLPLYLSAADILLMPYGRQFAGSSGGNIAEVSSPMKMFEYMAAGRTILTSDIPVLREVLDESNAVFYKPEDFEDLKNAFAKLLSDDTMRLARSAKAAEDVQQYDWKSRMKRVLAYYQTTA